MDINKIYNEDCLLTMNRMENDCIDLTVTSPPFYSQKKQKLIQLLAFYQNLPNE